MAARNAQPPLLEPGTVVAWRSRRRNGFGQVANTSPGHVTIRTWLPARSHHVTVPTGDVVAIVALTDLPALLAQAAHR